MYNLIITNTINNVKKSFAENGLNHDEFMTELSKYQGVIAGSFMFMNFAFIADDKNFLGASREYGDIDVYLNMHQKIENNNTSTYYTALEHRYKKSTEYLFSKPSDDLFYNYYHPFEHYLMRTFNPKIQQTDSYIFTDGILLSRMFHTDKIKINVVFVDQPVQQFINENFDLDCCKIIYDGKTCTAFNPDELAQGITRCRYNKCSLDHIYQNTVTPGCINSYRRYSHNYIPTGSGSIYESDAYKKFVLLYQAFINSKKPGTFTVNSDFNRYMELISLKYDLNKIFDDSESFDYLKINLTDDIVKIISMLRTHERIDKYKNRGIKTVLLEIDTIRI